MTNPRTRRDARPARPQPRLLAWGFCALSLLLVVAPAQADPRLRNLVFDPPTLSLAPGEVRALKLIGVYDDGSTRDVTSEVTLETRDWRVVEVLGTTIRAAGSGSTTVRAFHPTSGKNASDPLEVVVPEIVEIVVAPAQTSLAVGATTTVRALASLRDGRTGIDVSGLVEWTSSKTSVATVVGGVVSGIASGTAWLEVKDRVSGTRSPKNAASVTVGATGGGGTPTEPVPKIVALDAEPLEASLLPGEGVSLRVTARFDNGTTRDVTGECTFESTRVSTATVSSAGRVEAKAAGQISIRIAHATGKSASRDPEVWVGDVRQISLSPQAPELALGEALALRALATYDNGRTADVTEAAAWTTSDPRVVAVSDLEGSRGRITGVGAGVAVIAARDRASGLESRREAGTVRVANPDGAPPVEGAFEPRDVIGLVIEPSVSSMRPDESKTVRTRVLLRDGSTRAVGAADVSLVARDPRVVSVEADGTVTALRGGETEIRGEYVPTRKRAKVPARVRVASLRSLRVDPATLGLSLGEQRQLQALAAFDDGSTDVDVTAEVRWSSSKPEVATVDDASEKGRVAAFAKGVAEIRVEDPRTRRRSDRSTGRLSVADGRPADPSEIVALEFEPDSLLLAPGEVATFATFGIRVDGGRVLLSSDELDYDSTRRNVARTGRRGEVLGRRGGRAEIEVEHRPSQVVAFLPVLVRDIERMEVSPATVGLRVGDSADLKALAWFNDGTGPEDVTDQVRWRVADRSILLVDPDVPGRVVAISGGSTLVEALHRGSRVRADPSTGVVRVLGRLQRVLVDPERSALAVGGTQSFRAFGLHEDGTTVALDSGVLWSVSNTDVAQIDATGRLTALRTGEVRVRARDGFSGVSSRDSGDDGTVLIGSGVVGLQVTDASFVSAQPITAYLSAGEVRAFRGLAVSAAGQDPIDVTSSLVWSSTQPSVASVDAGGLVSCVSQGTARISARDPETGVTSTGTLGDATVICGGDVVAIRIQPATANVDYPNGRNMRAFRVLADGTEVEVTSQVLWSSSHPAALSIVESGPGAGRVTGIDDVIATVNAIDPEFGIGSASPGGTPSVVTVRKRRVDLRIFPVEPLPGSDGVIRGRVGDLMKLRSRVEFASGATQGSNVLHQWISSDPSVVRMGDGSGEILVNHGEFLKPGKVTITARWPADEFSPELTDRVTVEVLP